MLLQQIRAFAVHAERERRLFHLGGMQDEPASSDSRRLAGELLGFKLETAMQILAIRERILTEAVAAGTADRCALEAWQDRIGACFPDLAEIYARRRAIAADAAADRAAYPGR
ncbi:hypothetical protein ABEG18_06050 [Alsobacter sp. KACC 23698]|uniref:Uncharacterized protein n=1 Tax=Alsobacter sp. KACC 23698 TaxID=3149229 RepID=A0AAU7JJ43_9HYPH